MKPPATILAAALPVAQLGITTAETGGLLASSSACLNEASVDPSGAPTIFVRTLAMTASGASDRLPRLDGAALDKSCRRAVFASVLSASSAFRAASEVAKSDR